MDNMTAKVSCFARAYHSKNNKVHVFNDTAAEAILGDDYYAIAQNMVKGIEFFVPGFRGTEEKALRMIVDKQLSPSVLGRSAYCERMLQNEISLGCRQHVIFAAGYDTSGIRNDNENLAVFELDLPELFEDKNKRITRSGLESRSVQVPCNLAEKTWKEKLIGAGFDPKMKSFGSILGISYYLEMNEFEELIASISDVMPVGSAICFDYPEKNDGDESRKIRQLADGVGETMKAVYSPDELVMLLQKYGFKIYEHLNSEEMTEQFFDEYNIHNRQNYIEAPKGVSYCLAVKWRQER